MADLKTLKGVSDQDRKMIADAEVLLGPEPSEMGFIKNLFWGNLRHPLVFPYPSQDPGEVERCDKMIAQLDEYLEKEHPAIQIDQDQEIPRWVVDRLFAMGVLGMTIPVQYGGGGFGITSYNRVLERIGRVCGSTAVMVSAHQSIGCKAIMLFGTDEQKERWLGHLAKDWLSAFCLSEPNVGSDAGGQETNCHLSDDGKYYILNGEKKWATSAATSGVFTVMARHEIVDKRTGKKADKVTALVCTPDLAGIDIYEKNRSKCGIRGTWQGRLRFTDVHVPRENLLHVEGKGLNVALSCLNFGRCTLSAGMLGGAKTAFEQSTKWTQTRFQFQRPLADFELVQLRIARNAALCYAMDAVLYMTTGMLDRKDSDIMLETAACKVFCSEMGWRVVNDAMQIMGGESYMTEHHIERIFRDSRINMMVEGSNELMQSFIFAYGGKQLAERMLGVQQAVGWDPEQSLGRNLARIFKGIRNPAVMKAAAPLGAELLLGFQPPPPAPPSRDASLQVPARRLVNCIRRLSHQFKLASKHYGEHIVTRQAVQARLADCAMWLYAWSCTLSKLDRDLRGDPSDLRLQADRAAGLHFMELAQTLVNDNLGKLFHNEDDSMRAAAAAALRYSQTLPNSRFFIPERSPNAQGTGRKVDLTGIKQFPGNAK